MNYFNFNPRRSGFTLIELIIVVGVLAILLSIVLFAVNPSKQFSKANNSKRRSEIITLLNAVDHYMVDNHGQVPPGVTTSIQNIAKSGADLCTDLTITQKYITALPQDPTSNNGAPIKDCSSSYDTKITIVKDINNRVTINAPLAELGETISITR